MSGDSVAALKKFHDRHKLNFPLASDTAHKTLAAYGVWQERTMYGKKKMGIVRTTYILDPDGKVKHVFSKVRVEGHIREVLAMLKA